MARSRDIYGRRSTSQSRGKTHERIMALQHDPTAIPGTGAALEGCGDGSIGAALMAFHADWVRERPVAPRRAYERTIALLLRDLAANGPQPSALVAELSGERLVAHATWRRESRLTDPGELRRMPVHLARIATWLDEHVGTSLGDVRPALEAAVARLLDEPTA